VTESLQTS